MKVKCTNVITSTDKKVLTPFVKGSVYDAEPLIIKGKTIPNEWLINGAERPHVRDSGWIAIEGWKVKISPDGSLDGLIGTDYSSFGLTIDFLDDSENHANYPFAKCTCVGKATSGGANGSTYDPKY